MWGLPQASPKYLKVACSFHAVVGFLVVLTKTSMLVSIGLQQATVPKTLTIYTYPIIIVLYQVLNMDVFSGAQSVWCMINELKQEEKEHKR